MKYLHDRLQEDEIHIELVKVMNEKVIKILVAQAAVSNFQLEDQLRVTSPRGEHIKNQLSKHEVTEFFLEPTNFETITVDTRAWKQLINELTETT